MRCFTFFSSIIFFSQYFSCYTSLTSSLSQFSSASFFSFNKLVPSGIHEFLSSECRFQMYFSSMPQSFLFFLRRQKRQQMQLNLLWVLYMCYSNPSNSKSIQNRSWPHIQHLDSSSSSVASSFSLSSENLSMIVPEKISKMTFWANRMYVISDTTFKLITLQLKASLPTAVPRNPDPLLRLWSTSMSKQRKRPWQVAPQPRSSVKEKLYMQILQMQLKTISSPAAIAKENHVSTIACTICLPNEIRLTIQTRRKPAKRGCVTDMIEKAITQRSQKVSDITFPNTNTKQFPFSFFYNYQWRLEQQLLRKGHFLTIRLIRIIIPMKRLHIELSSNRRSKGQVGVRQDAKDYEKLWMGQLKSSIRQSRMMRQLKIHTTKNTSSSFFINFTSLPITIDLFSIQVSNYSSPSIISYTLLSNSIKLFSFQSWLILSAFSMSSVLNQSVNRSQRGSLGKQSLTRLPNTFASMVRVFVLKNSYAVQYFTQNFFISQAKGSFYKLFIFQTLRSQSLMEEKNFLTIFSFCFQRSFVTSIQSSSFSFSWLALSSIRWKQQKPIIKNTEKDSRLMASSQSSRGRKISSSLNLAPACTQSSQSQMRLILRSQLGTRMRTLLVLRSLASVHCSSSRRMLNLNRFSKQSPRQSNSFVRCMNTSAKLIPFDAQNYMIQSSNRLRLVTCTFSGCLFRFYSFRAADTISVNLLSTMKFWLAWLQPLRKDTKQSMMDSEISMVEAVSMSLSELFSRIMKQKELQILSRKSIEGEYG